MQQAFHNFTTLTQLIIIIAKPASALLHNAHFNTHIQDLTNFKYTFSKHNIKFNNTKKNNYLILHHLYFNTISNYFFTIFNLAHTTNIQTYKNIKFQNITTNNYFKI